MTTPRAAAPYRIDPFDLRLFAAIVEHGSITAGARHIHLSLAAASTRLQQLEHAIGATLLLRSKRGVRTTDAGRTLLLHAGRLQREMEALHADMAAHAHGVRSTVRVLCNTAAMTEHLPQLLGRFLVAHPDIDVELRELGSRDALMSMRQGQADIGIMADNVSTEGLRTRFFREDQLVAVLPRQGARASNRPMPFVDLLERPFVGLPSDSGISRLLHDRALQHGRGLHHRVRVRGLDALMQLVGEGVGVAVVPQATAVRLANERVVVRPLSDAWATRQLLLCTAGDVPLGAGAEALYGFLVQQGGADRLAIVADRKTR